VLSRLDYGDTTSHGGGLFAHAVERRRAAAAEHGLRYEHNSVYGGIAVPEFGAS